MGENDIFERSMADLGVEPLDGGGADRCAAAQPGPQAARHQREDVEESERQIFEQAMRELDGEAVRNKADPQEEIGPPPDRRDGRPPVRRVKPPAARAREKDSRIGEQLDLHGMKSDEALRRLEGFVAMAAGAGEKAVLVITGKGHHSAGGRGVLKRRVEEWIHGPGRRRVRAYSEAPRRLGGRGAWILYLRKPPS